MKKIIPIVSAVVLAGIAVVWLMMPKGPFCQSCAMPMISTLLLNQEATLVCGSSGWRVGGLADRASRPMPLQ